MNPADEQSGITALTHGDEADGRELRANLAVFARQTDNPEMRSLVTDVLGGRRNVREVLRSPQFLDVAARRVANLEAGIARLSDEQRAELLNTDRPYTPEAKLAAMRDGVPTVGQQPVIPPAAVAAPKRPRPVSADEDDEDFSQTSYTERAN
ncbi:MAG TPA: hypothetical protein VG756_19425 [Pseudonocardiaceae bacterium]|jgi:hypothetical protein|nr:hypothetical protein [Pseudonocardiaceae bacterium]